jgi:hypothetical protein
VPDRQGEEPVVDVEGEATRSRITALGAREVLVALEPAARATIPIASSRVAGALRCIMMPDCTVVA